MTVSKCFSPAIVVLQPQKVLKSNPLNGKKVFLLFNWSMSGSMFIIYNFATESYEGFYERRILDVLCIHILSGGY